MHETRTPLFRVFVATLACGVAGDNRGQCTFNWTTGPTQGMPGTSNPVSALVTWDPDGAGPQPPLLVAGGDSGVAGTQFANYVAAWDGSSWQALGFGVGGSVLALTVYNGELIAGGRFTTASGLSANHVAIWNGISWRAAGAGLNNTVNALTVYNGELIAAGTFTTADGASANHIARWNGSAWQPLGAGMNSIVYALTVYGGELVAGGTFTTAGDGKPARTASPHGTS